MPYGISRALFKTGGMASRIRLMSLSGEVAASTTRLGSWVEQADNMQIATSIENTFE
jgi:hypothetical protein